MPAAPTVRRRRLGAELRRLRERMGLTAEEIATRLDWSPSKLSRIENARIGVRVSDVRLLLELYEVDERHMGELLALAHAATQRGWWAAYEKDLMPGFARFVALEDEADSSSNYVTYSLPGLLQSEEYARYVLESSRSAFPAIPPQKVDRRLEVRMRRQRLLFRDPPLRFSAIIDESVLMRSVGERETMRRQLVRLAELTDLPNLELHVLPLRNPRTPVFGDDFTLLRFSPAYEVVFPEVLYIDGLQTSEHQEEELTYSYRLAWDSLRSSALSHAESTDRIARAAAEI
ncbi:helix-turn-helix transcriptional regulator [Actinomadura kijaniata]|uniref:Transcriptional regulator with XRE-family HTH domain n=1 Tax=Actinomadura namibiensis TaxID=182080 RepID=A0A7W3QM54_ACTNM|nr:helix-turn-helix transcriptional regulator [Actinomadura namibiensis]MBA8952212.1 transcriptional regulator with XRE-family HTH domain [Actinomadura namibiensis]